MTTTPRLTARPTTDTGEIEYVLAVGDTVVGTTTSPDVAAQQLAAAVFATVTQREQLRVMDVIRLTGCTLGQAVAAITANRP